jgi:hypothetical protein
MSKVKILQDDGQTFVRKTGNVSRNLERLDALARLNIQLPKVLNVYGNSYDMEYILDRDKENNQCLQLTGFMQREKWATLQDADDLRKFAFHLEKNHKNLKVKVALALSIKEAEETDEDYNFTQAFFTKNEEMRDMLIQMHQESEAEDDEKLFGGDDE